MALKQELMASSLPAAAASKLGYDAPALTVAATGSTQGGAAPLVSNFSIVTSGGGNGVIITESKARTGVINISGGTVTVYPPVGCFINGLTVNTGFAIGNNKQATFDPAGLYFLGNLSA